ncbi:MAG: FkbM family methyltransferase [Potamolinea sp.]
MQLPNYLNRPEYIFRPFQIYRRLLRSSNKETNKVENILLPWGVTIKICPSSNEVVGRSLWLMGIYDLVVTEVLWRLIKSDETAIDVGASLGYMTNIMAKKVGKTGKVWCFEPNPEAYKELSENVANWHKTLDWNQINTQQIALSNQSGVGVLSVPTNNREEATLVSTPDLQNQANISENYTVTLARLDDILKNNSQIGLMKIDVEGHELAVLQGATELISKQQIRDIIYEDHSGYPTPVSKLLEQHGYTIFRIWKGFWKPLLEPPTKKLIHQWEPPSYLATKEPSRAIELLKKRGWSSLQG